MVQYVLKRYATGSTATVGASDSVNGIQIRLERMIKAVNVLKMMGEDQKPIEGDILPQEAVDECKEILMEVIKYDLSEKLHEAGDGWGFEDLIFPKPED